MFWLISLSESFLINAVVNAQSVLLIGDYDTISVTEGNQRIKVRLACIDAPETLQTPYGLEARKQFHNCYQLDQGSP